MPFNAAELANIANSALDFFFNKGDYFAQTIQKKPLVDLMERKAKEFPGGKGNISVAVKGIYGNAGVSDGLTGYTTDDVVTFYNPVNMVRAIYPWREMHLGISLTHTELKIDGLSVSDTNGTNVTSHSDRDLTALVNIFNTKLEDMAEQYARSLDTMLWGDGTADPKAMTGLAYFISTTPAVGTVGGIDRSLAANAWWRNRAQLAIASDPANGGALLQFMQKERRQLVRYGGNPDTIMCGTDFLTAMETEMRANGLYTMTGYKGTQDGAMGGMNFRGSEVIYAPTLDDLGHSKRAYWFDSSTIFLDKMSGEWRRAHTPARPENKFVLFRSITCTGQLVMTQGNCNGVYEIA